MDSPPIYWVWRNEATRRHYSAHLSRDLLGDWTLVRAWGSLDNARGRITQEVIPSYAEGLAAVERTAQRRKRHGYTQLTPVEQAC